jgi:hypothetical protein
MKKQLVLTASIVLASSLIPFLANAEDLALIDNPTTAPPELHNASSEMSKTQWLNTIVPMLPSLICKGFMGDSDLKQRLDKIKMNYGQCVAAIPASVNRCQSQLSASIPDTINNEAAAIWGKSLGECIGKDFAMKYLLPRQ